MAKLPEIVAVTEAQAEIMLCLFQKQAAANDWFHLMTAEQLVTACHERMLRTVGDRATVIARLNRHTARGGGVIPGRKT